MAKLTQKSDTKLALHEIDEALKCAPYNGECYHLRTEILMNSGLDHASEALESCSKAIELDPSIFYAWHAKVLCLALLKRFDEADAVLGEMRKNFHGHDNDLQSLTQILALGRARR